MAVFCIAEDIIDPENFEDVFKATKKFEVIIILVDPKRVDASYKPEIQITDEWDFISEKSVEMVFNMTHRKEPLFV